MTEREIMLTLKEAAAIAYGYEEHWCLRCGGLHSVPPWFKPFKEYCDKCRPARIEENAGLDREKEDEEEVEHGQ
jgi:hypothetical protein